MDNKQLSQLGISLDGWKFTRELKPRPLNGYYIEGVSSKAYSREVDGVICTMGCFFLHDVEMYRAWGMKEEEHCSFNILRDKSGSFSESIEGCPDITVTKLADNKGLILLKGHGKTVEYGVTFLEDSKPSKTFLVKGLSCNACVETLQSILSRSYTGVSVRLTPPTLVVSSPEPVKTSELNALLADTKYSVSEESIFSSIYTNTIKFMPLIVMLSAVLVFTFVHMFVHGLSVMSGMQYFMAGYFLLFGGLKVVNWKKFVPSYQAYDVVAKQNKVYAWVYPAIEFGLGVVYCFGFATVFTNIFVLVLMLQKALSVHKKIKSGVEVQCACLGGFFSIPVTRVTFFEDLLMAGMALLMLFW